MIYSGRGRFLATIGCVRISFGEVNDKVGWNFLAELVSIFMELNSFARVKLTLF